jgi:hypothetical protein
MGFLAEVAASILDFITIKLLGPTARGLGTMIKNMLYRGLVTTGSLFTNMRMFSNKLKPRTY